MLKLIGLFAMLVSVYCLFGFFGNLLTGSWVEAKAYILPWSVSSLLSSLVKA